MSLVAELRKKSSEKENVKFEVVREIKESFSNYVNSETFEEDLSKSIGKDAIENRKSIVNILFDNSYGYSYNCLEKTWHSPEKLNKYWSPRYKGIDLFDLSNEICLYVMEIVTEKLTIMGFNILKKTPGEQKHGKYKAVVEFGW